MGDVSRTKRSFQNIGVGVLVQVLTTALGFIVRTFFITHLGVELLGVQSLLLGLLAVIALADVGFAAALMYALYEPLSKRDELKITAIVNYAAKIYRRIALIVGITGLCMLPILENLVNLEGEVEHLQIYFIVLLVNAVAEFAMVYRTVLLNADQRGYVVRIYSFVFTAIRSLVQVIVLIEFESFLLFLMIHVCFTLANNVAIFLRVGQLHPYIRHGSPQLEPKVKASLWQSVRAMIVYRVGGLILNSSDAVLISILVGTVALGYFANYLLIVGSIVMVCEIAFAAIIPSVGNHVATKQDGSAVRLFDEITAASILLHGAISVALVAFLTDVITIWLGSGFEVSPWVVILLAANFYLVGTLYPIYSFRTATGMFKRTRFVILVTAIIKIGIAIPLGMKFGIAGILGATILARLVTVAWYEPRVLLNDYLVGDFWKYARLQLSAGTFWVACGALIWWSSESLLMSRTQIIATKSLFLVIITVAVCAASYRWNPAVRRLTSRVRRAASSRL